MNTYYERATRRAAIIWSILGALILSPIFVDAAHCEPLIIPQSALIIVNGVDLHSTYRVVRSGNGHEGNPLMFNGVGWKPVLVKSATTIGAILALREVAKTKPKMARIALWSVTAVLLGVSYRNYQIATQ